jgi:hypothetical protein
MRLLVLGLASLLMLASAGRALDDKEKPKPDKPLSTAEAYKALVAEFTKANQDFFKEYREAKPEERQNLVREKYPLPKYGKKFLEFAQAHPKDPEAVDALAWVVTNVRSGPDVETAMSTLFTDHVESDRLGQVCGMMVYSGSDKTEKLLRVAIKKNPHKDVQGQAYLALAEYLRRQVSGGKVDEEKDREAMVKEARELLERVVKDYADVKAGRGALAEQAKAKLKGLDNVLNLVAGKPAPEIEGEDVDGQKFKLSDYRGKVVLLDFWGHW